MFNIRKYLVLRINIEWFWNIFCVMTVPPIQRVDMIVHFDSNLVSISNIWFPSNGFHFKAYY